MAVPKRMSDQSRTLTLKASLHEVLLPTWMRESMGVLRSASDGDTIVVKTDLDRLQVEAGAQHLGKKIRVVVDKIVEGERVRL